MSPTMFALKFERPFGMAIATLTLGGLLGCSKVPQIPHPAPTKAPVTQIGGNLMPDAASRSFHVSAVWTNPAFHGDLVIAAGYDYTKAMIGGLACSACHAGESPSEPSPNVQAPNCFACHDGGPDGSALHPPGWVDPSSPYFHGAVVIQADYDTNAAMAGNLPCAACHATLSPDQASPNTRAPSCYLCHAGGPDGSAGHPDGWMDVTSPFFHGKAVQATGFNASSTGLLSCGACHAGDSPTESSTNVNAPNCFSCHAGGPNGSAGHPEGWDDPTSHDFHGLVVEAANYDYTKAKAGGLTCNTCHAGNNASQPSPNTNAPNCFSCHAGGPDGSPGHPCGWLDPTNPNFHGIVVEAAGDNCHKAKWGGLTCNTCHACDSPTQTSANPNAPNCYTCHPSGPPW